MTDADPPADRPTEAFVSSPTGSGVTFRLADPEHRADRVAVWCEVPLPSSGLAAVPGGWELVLPDLPVGRVEYLLDVDGSLVLDPGNPRRVPGAFGDHSWLSLAGYREPAWLDAPRVPAVTSEHTVAGTAVGDVDLVLWAPADADPAARLPLLAAHDGPELAAFGRLTDYLAALVAAGTLPPCRVALLAPGARNERYAANPAYTDALVDRVLPRLAELAPHPAPPVLAGASLGGLAALHAAWTRPGRFDGLFLMSGSFFVPELDGQEAGFTYWDEVVSFVAAVHDPDGVVPPLPPVGVVCGSAEENLANNRLLRARLAAVGARVHHGEIGDGHTWTCWRDLLDPFLTRLLLDRWA